MLDDMFKAGAKVFLQTSSGQYEAEILESNATGVLVKVPVPTREGPVDKQRFFPWEQIQFAQAG